jgi:hypothetical protein
VIHTHTADWHIPHYQPAKTEHDQSHFATPFAYKHILHFTLSFPLLISQFLTTTTTTKTKEMKSGNGSHLLLFKNTGSWVPDQIC